MRSSGLERYGRYGEDRKDVQDRKCVVGQGLEAKVLNLDDVREQAGHIDVRYGPNVVVLALMLKHELPAGVPVLRNSPEQLLLAAGPRRG